MSDVTQILHQIETGDPTAADLLLPLVYDELRKLAAVRLQQEKPGQTLQATGLVHEAYLRLVGPDGSASFANRQHFFALACIDLVKSLLGQGGTTDFQDRQWGIRRTRKSVVPLN